MKYIHLPLEGAYNVRDIGGYAADGGATSWNTFIRGDSLSNLTKEDIQLMKDYGIKTIIDLRGNTEVEKEPDKVFNDPHFIYKHISLFRGVKEVATEDITKVLVNDPEGFLIKTYITVLNEAKDSIREVLTYMAECGEGGILFHCTGGKDRTGNIAALLLSLAGVNRSDIVANYEVTFTYLRESPSIKKRLEHYPEALLHSKAIYIINVLDHINENYGDVKGYMKAIGVSDENIERLKEKLIER